MSAQPGDITDTRLRTWKVHPVDGFPILAFGGPWASEPMGDDQFLLADGRFGYVTTVTDLSVYVRPVRANPDDTVDITSGQAFVELPLDPER